MRPEWADVHPASYVLLAPDHIQFVRVEYPVDAVAEKVYAIKELDDYQGTRLKEGR